MKSISEFFQKILSRQTQGAFVQTAIKDAIREQSGVAVDALSVSFSGMEVVIKNLDQSAKSAVFIKKPAILKAIESRGLNRIVKDIRTP